MRPLPHGEGTAVLPLSLVVRHDTTLVQEDALRVNGVVVVVVVVCGSVGWGGVGWGGSRGR